MLTTVFHSKRQITVTKFKLLSHILLNSGIIFSYWLMRRELTLQNWLPLTVPYQSLLNDNHNNHSEEFHTVLSLLNGSYSRSFSVVHARFLNIKTVIDITISLIQTGDRRDN